MFNRRGSISETTISWLFVLGILWIQFGGIYHSATKHNSTDLIFSIVVPPFAWYRSIEFFWHDDFSGVDWDKRIKNDFRATLEILDNEAKNKNNLENNNNKEYLHQRVKEYPSIQKDKVETAVLAFMNYQILLFNGMHASMKNIPEIGQTDWKETEEMKNQRASFENYFTETELKFMLDSNTEALNKIKQGWVDNQDFSEKRDVAEKKMKEIESLWKERYQGCFKEIFDKDIKL